MNISQASAPTMRCRNLPTIYPYSHSKPQLEAEMDTMTHSLVGGDTRRVERLGRAAAAGELTKADLASLLTPESRYEFLEGCAAIEKRFTDECAASGNPCLEDGCAMDGDPCLQALLKTGPEYLKACGAEWI